MIRRLRAMWANLRSAPLVVDAPAGDMGSLDEREFSGPVGEVPPLTDAQAERLWNDMFPGIPFADRIPLSDWDEHQDSTIERLEGEWDK